MADKLVIDCATGTQSLEPLTTEEQADRAAMATAATQARQTETTRLANRTTIEQAALAAIATNKTYIGRATPTAAQQTAQIRALSQQQNGIIRLLLAQLDATD